MILSKREKLVQFIREQTIGPGALGYRYVDLQNCALLESNLKTLVPGSYHNEIINNVPGATYSTGILFPDDASQSAIIETDPNINSENDDEVDGSHENVNNTDISEDDDISLNQMYPNRMGLTLCVEGSISDVNQLSIKVSTRYYSKINRETVANFCGVLLEQDLEIFRSFVQALPDYDIIKNKIIINEVNDNVILTLKEIHVDDIRPLKARLREIDREKTASLNSDKPGQYLSGFKEFLYRKLRNEVLEHKEQIKVAEKIKAIETCECSIAHISDLIGIFDSRGYGLWRCEVVEKQIVIPPISLRDIGTKTILSYSKYPDYLKDIIRFDQSKDEHASLSLNLQFSRDSRRKQNRIFLKIQLVNTSTAFTVKAGDSRYFSAFNEVVNQRSFFGVSIAARGTHIMPYREIEVNSEVLKHDEDKVTSVLYAQYKDFAIGHGTSVKWNGVEKVVETEYIPSFDTPDVDPTPRVKNVLVEKEGIFEPKQVFQDGRVMQFKALSTFSDFSNDELLRGLNDFVDAYATWISDKRLDFVNGVFNHVAAQELAKCEQDMLRMKSNVAELLSGSNNSDNLLSFRLMNNAMFMQLWHSVHVKKETIDGFMDQGFTSFDEEFYRSLDDRLFSATESAAWRPFQLAFILLNLDGICQRSDDPNWDRRNNLVDLVWFPTGGGKTEAYLGIIALTILCRRRKNGIAGGGTAVLMRYTLRLLTLQQFQRATLLIMGLELMRRWGIHDFNTEEPIYIGLWVGEGSLPNTLADLSEEYGKIKNAQENRITSFSSKIPFSNCPWCGYPLNPISVAAITDQSDVYYFNRILLKCSRPEHKCSFSMPLREKKRRKDHGPIPVSLCDEEIYQQPPALLFGTVDKFAQLAHKVSNDPSNRHKDSRRIFGVGNWEAGKSVGDSGYLSPDLIIQDELHLLLGPLGSSVALFESAIDQLSTRLQNGQPLRPKVISSTATTRNTALQTTALFDRKLNVFPKPGIECDDSFYAFYERWYSSNNVSQPNYKSKRRYVGILPTGRTQMWMQMRLSAIIMVHRAMCESERLGENGYPIISGLDSDAVNTMDNYHTMLSYFNSLKEVGKTESQIHTYIIKEIRRVFNKVLRPGKMMHPLYTYAISSGELTGRLSGEEVKKELDRVSSKWKPMNRFAHLDEGGNKKVGHVPPDFVVATNMISVGIDVSRFNTIIMNGMPRNLAEYIQASSRVARNTYGLVVTVHHPFRARDISHFEKFIEFHEKMYSYVEPISITPFTPKAISRYLSLYNATMLRHRTEFVARDSASAISSWNNVQVEHLVQSLLSYFVQREARMESESDLDPLIRNILTKDNLKDIETKLNLAIQAWKTLARISTSEGKQLVFTNKAKATTPQVQLYVDIDEYEGNIHSRDWQVPQSLRVIEPEAVIRIKSK